MQRRVVHIQARRERLEPLQSPVLSVEPTQLELEHPKAEPPAPHPSGGSWIGNLHRNFKGVHTKLYLGIDDDDEGWPACKRELEQHLSIPWIVLTFPPVQPAIICPIWASLARAAVHDGCGYLVLWGDDVSIEPADWMPSLRAKLAPTELGCALPIDVIAARFEPPTFRLHARCPPMLPVSELGRSHLSCGRSKTRRCRPSPSSRAHTSSYSESSSLPRSSYVHQPGRRPLPLRALPAVGPERSERPAFPSGGRCPAALELRSEGWAFESLW